MDEEMTLKRIDELLQFLPLFRRPGREFVEGGERNDDGVISIPYPVYQPDVIEFFRLAGQDAGRIAALLDRLAVLRAELARR